MFTIHVHAPHIFQMFFRQNSGSVSSIYSSIRLFPYSIPCSFVALLLSSIAPRFRRAKLAVRASLMRRAQVIDSLSFALSVSHGWASSSSSRSLSPFDVELRQQGLWRLLSVSRAQKSIWHRFLHQAVSCGSHTGWG